MTKSFIKHLSTYTYQPVGKRIMHCAAYQRSLACCPDLCHEDWYPKPSLGCINRGGSTGARSGESSSGTDLSSSLSTIVWCTRMIVRCSQRFFDMITVPLVIKLPGCLLFADIFPGYLSRQLPNSKMKFLFTTGIRTSSRMKLPLTVFFSSIFSVAGSKCFKVNLDV